MCVEKDCRIKNLEIENIQKSEQIDGLRKLCCDVEAKDRRIKHLEEAVLRLNVDRGTIDQMARVISEQQLRIKELESFSILNSELKKKIEALEQELDQTKDSVKRNMVTEGTSSRLSGVEDGVVTVDDEIVNLRMQLEESVSTIRALKTAFRLTMDIQPVARNEYPPRSDSISDSDNTIKKLHDMLDAAEARRGRVEIKLAAEISKLERSEDRRIDLQIKIDQGKRRYDRLLSEMESLKSENEELTAKIAELQDASSQL